MSFTKHVEEIIKNKVWLSLILLVIFAININFLFSHDLKSLPSPIYGGDYYYQLGAVNHVKYGGNPLESSSMNGELPVYLPLYSFFVGNIARLFNIDSINAMFIFSYLIIIASMIVIYILAQRIFNSYLISLVISLIFLSYSVPIPVVKYTDFGTVLMVPLFLLFFYNFLMKMSIRNSIFLGISYGLLGLTHPVIFIFATLLLISGFIYYGYKEIFFDSKKSRSKSLKELKQHILNYFIVFIIGVPIALLYWYYPIFFFHGKPTMFIGNTFSISYQFNILINFIKELFFNFSGIAASLRSILLLGSILGMFIIRTEKKELGIIKFFFISYLIIVFHYLITQNFLGFNLVPEYMISTFVVIPSLFLIIGVIVLSRWINMGKILTTIFYVMLISLLVISVGIRYKSNISDKWHQAGQNDVPPQLASLQKFMSSNGGVNDVIITTKEVGFSVNSLTGRKLIATRRGHSGEFLFINPDIRESDLSIILYGNNTVTKKQLIDKYGAKYLYWDYYWIQSEYYFDDKGNIVNWFDPLLVVYDNKIEKKLKDNDVKYFIEMSWVDPTVRGDSVQKSKIMFISPENYYNYTHPWNPNLDQFLEEVWSYDSNGQRIAVLYKIKD